MEESKLIQEPNSYADANRLRKVLRLIEVFRIASYSADQVASMNADQWRLAAVCAGVGWDDRSTHEITIDLVVRTMQDYEELPKRKVNAAQARSILGRIEADKPKRKRKPR